MAAPKGREDFRPGDIVRLSRIKVQKYNNATGKIVEYNVDDAGVGRYVIQMQQSGELVAVRAHNLTKVSQNGRKGGDGGSAPSGNVVSDADLQRGDYVEISGLKLRSTSQFNGQTGYIVEYVKDKRGVGRYTVIVEGSQELVALRARYLRKMEEKYGKGNKGLLTAEDNDAEGEFTLWNVVGAEGVTVHADADPNSAKVGNIPNGMVVQAIGNKKTVGDKRGGQVSLIPVFDGWIAESSTTGAELLREIPPIEQLNQWQTWV